MRRRKPFQFKKFTISQENVAMPVTTDACILGAVAEILPEGNTLDIGAGTGLLSLMLAQRFANVNFTAVELDAESAAEAAENFDRSPWADRLSLIEADILEYEPGKQFESIVCNPPFFEKQLASDDPRKSRARHTASLNYESLAMVIERFLAPGGKGWVLLPNLHLDQFEQHLRKNKLSLNSILNIAADETKEPHVCIVTVSFLETIPAISRLNTYLPAGGYTAEMKELMDPFYL